MLNKWCEKTWMYVLYFTGIIMTAVLIFNWNEWSWIQRVLSTITIIIPLHVLEEWQLPGGFHYQYNTCMGSKYPNKYPMNRLTDMLTNSLAQVLFIGLIIYGANAGIMIAITIFSALEVIAHSFFGYKMYKIFKSRGKKTIYGPGSITAYGGFGVVGVLSFIWLLQNGTTGHDWLVGITILVFMFIGLILIPEQLLKKEDNEYEFSSAKYYEKYIK